MADPILKLKILARTEMTLLKLQARRNALRMEFFLFALVFALLALAMLNLAGYQVLAVRLGPVFAALIVALVDVLLCLILVFISRRAGSEGPQEQTLGEIRDLAYSELSSDLANGKATIEQVAVDLQRIRSGFSAFTGLTEDLSVNISSILSLLVRTVKKRFGHESRKEIPREER